VVWNDENGVMCDAPDNHIGDEGAEALSPHLAKLANITSLNLYCAFGACGCMPGADNNVGQDSAKALGPHLAKLESVTTLDLGCA